MRLHRLEVCAFGPYAGRESPTDALGADGLFLLHGDTGGKTTLPSTRVCVVRAVPSPWVKRLRCDLADADTFHRVSWSRPRHHLRIVRPRVRAAEAMVRVTPHSRPRHPDLAPVHRPTGTAEVVTRIDEAGRIVERLLA